MFDDVVADFWKDKLVHLMHRNMVRANAERLAFSDVKNAFDDFAKNHPDFPAEETITNSYATWEINVTEEIKLRVFIQSAIKITLLQKQGTDYIKIADARFPNNPFPEIHVFLQMRDEYIKMLNQEQRQTAENSCKIKIARQFIIAYLNKKFGEGEIIWKLEENNQNFNLTLTKEKEEKTITLNYDDFKNKIDQIKFN